MLKDAYDVVRKNYYDPTFHGIDLDARYKEFDGHINDIHSLGEGLALVSNFLHGFNDSHLYFEPPARPAVIDSGYTMQMVGLQCFITHVRPGSDAEKRLHPGDEVLQLNGFNMLRKDFDEIDRYFHTFSPGLQEKLQVNLENSPQDIVVKSAIYPRKRVVDFTTFDGDDYADNREELLANRVIELDSNVMIWKMPEFEIEPEVVKLNTIFGKAQRHSTLILDLRGNPGGYNEILQDVMGRFFDHIVKIADVTARKPEKPAVAKNWGSTYQGKLIVLVDSESASAAELFARVIQLEKRGVVMGDKTAGAVMEAKSYPRDQGTDSKIMYGFSVTYANMIMTDGKSLEGVGVTPDVVVLPTAADLAAGKDPVLAKAIETAGGKTTPEEAGKLFPYIWPKLQ
ncbi:MAG TPA: S41 family peptidase [Acidobacteriaceae bacterium]